jgi:hypothetical protein
MIRHGEHGGCGASAPVEARMRCPSRKGAEVGGEGGGERLPGAQGTGRGLYIEDPDGNRVELRSHPIPARRRPERAGGRLTSGRFVS